MSGAQHAVELRRNIRRCAATAQAEVQLLLLDFPENQKIRFIPINGLWQTGHDWITSFSVHVNSKVGTSNQIDFNLIEKVLHM